MGAGPLRRVNCRLQHGAEFGKVEAAGVDRHDEVVVGERSLDDFTNFENKIKSLKLDVVNAALRKYFDKSKLVLIYSGDFKKKGF